MKYLAVLLLAVPAFAQQPPPVFIPVQPSSGYYWHPGIGSTKPQIIMPGGGILEIGGGGAWLPMPKLNIPLPPPPKKEIDFSKILDDILKEK
jgi:hypothetical protein